MNPKKKIIIAADTYPPDINGSAHFSARLAQGLAKKGYEIHVIAPSPKKGPSYSMAVNGIIEHRLHSHAVSNHQTFRLCFPWQIKKEIRHLFDTINPDVVHVQCHYLIGRLVVNEAVARTTRLIATNHFVPECLSPYLPFPQWINNKIAQISWRDIGRVFKKADKVTTPSSLAIKPLEERAELAEVIPISNGVDLSKFYRTNEQQLKPATPTILFVGRLDPDKNIPLLLEAIKHLQNELIVHLNIVGHGLMRKKLEDKAVASGIQNQIHFLGSVNENELREAYQHATVFCMPGAVELQSIATLEAMASACPVLLAEAMALPLLIDNNKNGYLFNPLDSHDLAAKIKKIVQLPLEELQAMGNASFQLVQKHHIDKTLEAYERLYFPHEFS
ncbi:glycosyltransferase [Legionella lytica]|uniref:Glycosyltransferase n=1 Tax=Legionella lytica TaxID=96232 RepID=A0ABW8D7B1_9GAMM